jgi:hypothetical protein
LLLVTYGSATGEGRRPRIPFEVGGHVGRLDQLRLLNHPAVYARIRDWIAPNPGAPGGAAAGDRPV